MDAPVHRSGEGAALIEDLAHRLARRLGGSGSPSRLVVGLAGPPGSGKSTLCERLAALLDERRLLAGAVPMDGFHLSNTVLDLLGRHGRKGAPDTFDVDGYLATLDRVRAPGAPDVLAPVYRRDLHEPVAAGSLVAGPGVVLTEGNYLALAEGPWAEARARIDVLVMVAVPEAVLVERLVARHEAHGRAAADAAHWVRTVDLPNASTVVSSASRCDEVWHLTG